MRAPVLPRTLVGRIVGGSLVAAVVASAALVVLLVSLFGLRHSIGEETHSNDTVNAALVLEGRVSTYESALHAYLLTTNRGLLRQGLRQLASSWYIVMFQLPLLAPLAWQAGLGRLWPEYLARREGVQEPHPNPTQTADGS